MTATPNDVVVTDVAAENAQMVRMLEGLGAVPSKPQDVPC